MAQQGDPDVDLVPRSQETREDIGLPLERSLKYTPRWLAFA